MHSFDSFLKAKPLYYKEIDHERVHSAYGIKAKPLYYKEIDHERVHSAYGMLKPHVKQPRTIHVVGTNGKGSTGRMISHLAHKSGLTVGHFSSPHILKFNERIWLNGSDSRDAVLIF